MNKQTLYSIALVGLITSCGGAGDTADELVLDFRTNSKSVSEVKTNPGYRLEFEVVPNEDLFGDLTYKWSTNQPNAGLLREDSPFSAITVGRKPGRYRSGAR